MKTYLIIITVIVACSSEPHCSKFHYEEKMLEKMIRTEILVENMKKQIDDMETRITGALAKLSEDTATWKGEIETMQESSKTNLITLQEKAKSELDKNMQAVQDLKDKVVSPNIAFHAKNIKNGSPANGETIVFTDILLNLGESYNTDTGVFTVPLGGIYLFTVQLCIDQSKRIDYGLVVDGVYMDIARHQDNYSSVCCFKLTTTIPVQSGKKVWVKVISQTSSGQILFHTDTNYWTSFSGVLIHTD
ncbi:heavy metal-binding protein HIP-like [Ruditapes philippinarum]|uniref:heavy metal-binding protein HIP-like n=1 Tax=Ruditapes philippinarum TaxID=129788 RepID=UPI00295AD4AC|nr:heavy metal-binding protein HIP-like [Ruditapes philippinarum]